MTTFKRILDFRVFMENEVELQEFGLTKIESKVYLALLKIGSTTTGPLVRKTELHRATVYDVLKRLMEKGLVNYVIKQKTKYFEATYPEYFLEKITEEEAKLQEKTQMAKELVGNLNKIKEKSGSKEEAHVFKGVKGIKTIFEEILQCKEYLVIGSKGKFKETLGDFYDLFQKQKKLRKVKSMILLPESLKNTSYTKSIYGSIRYLPKEFDSPTATFIYDEKVAIFIFIEQPIAFVLESKELVKSYKEYFDLLWKLSKL